jgi:hypothetical protein
MSEQPVSLDEIKELFQPDKIKFAVTCSRIVWDTYGAGLWPNPPPDLSYALERAEQHGRETYSFPIAEYGRSIEQPHARRQLDRACRLLACYAHREAGTPFQANLAGAVLAALQTALLDIQEQRDLNTAAENAHAAYTYALHAAQEASHGLTPHAEIDFLTKTRAAFNALLGLH